MYYPEKDSSPHRGYMFYEQAVQLAKTGWKVGLVFVEQRPTRNFSWKRFSRESHFQITTEDNGIFTTLRLHAWNPKLSTRTGGKIWSFLTRLAVKKYIRKYGKPDLIHAHFAVWAGYTADTIRRRHHIPYIITEHASSITGGNVPLWQRDIFRSVYNNAGKVICVGTLLKRKLEEYVTDPEKITVVPNFVDTEIFHPSTHHTEKEKEFVFISVANLTQRKGIHDLLDAFHNAFRNHPQVKLKIVGEGEEKEALEQKVNKLQLNSRVAFTGRLGREQLAEELAESDAFVLASYAETFGIVYIEAMSTGMPAIGTVCGGPEDIITSESGFLVKPGDVDELADKMYKLYDSYESFDKPAISKSIKERYDFKLAGPTLAHIYQSILDNENSSCR